MIFAFGDFELDGELAELRRGQRLVTMQPKVLRMLLYLVACRERVVPAAELLGALWPGETVTEWSVRRAIASARRALGEADEPRSAIRTVRGHGYQFILPAVARERARRPGAEATGERPQPQPQLRDVFVGREGVMDVVTSACAQAIAGRGRILMLVGEPGIGKTHMLHEVAGRAARAGADAWLGRCLEEEGAPAFWPWVQILREAARSRGASAFRAAMGPGAADIAEALPALEPWLDGLHPAPPIENLPARFRLFDSISLFLNRTAQRRPIVLLFDDLQRADPPSLRLLAFVAHQLDTSRILIVAALRPSPALVRQIPCEHLELTGLDVPEIAEYLEARTRSRAPSWVADRLHEHTGGNPLFLRQLVQGSWITDGLDGTPRWESLIASPTTGLHGAIDRRLETLSVACRELLRVASVLGREFAVGDVAHMLDRPAELVLEQLAEATEAGIVRELPGVMARRRFAHVLLRDALYERTPAHRRAQLHLRAGQALESRYPTSDPATLSELAHHFAQAATAHDDGRALTYALQAAKAAQQSLAYEQAAAHFECALELCQGPRATAEQRMQLLLAKGEALTYASDRGAARRALLDAVALARELHAVDAIARAATLIAQQPECAAVDRTQVELLREAIAALPAGDPRSPYLQGLLAKSLTFSPDGATRRRLVLQALGLARQLADTGLRAEALLQCHHGLCEPDFLDQRVAIASELERLGHERGDHRLLLHAAAAKFRDCLEIGDLPGLEAAVTMLEALAQHVREPFFRWHAITLRALLHFLAGRVEVAEGLWAEGLQMGVCLGEHSARAYYCSQVCGPWRMKGRGAEAEALVRETSLRYPALAGWRAVLAVLEAIRGRTVEARRTLEQIMDDDLRVLRNDPYAIAALAPAVELCVLVGDAASADAFYDALRPYARYWGNVGWGLTTHGPTTRLLGILATHTGDFITAARHFEDSLASTRHASAPVFEALTCTAYAHMLLKNQEHRRATEVLTRARTLAAASGLTAIVARCDTLASAPVLTPRQVTLSVAIRPSSN